MTSSAPLTLVAICTAKPGKEQALRTLQEELVAGTLKEPGCIRYELHQSIEDPRVLIFVETWATEQAWNDHMQGSAIKRFQDAGVGEMLGNFTLHRMSLVAGGGRG